MEQTNMSIWSLVGEASIVVQLVMMCLIVFSIISWMLIFKHSATINKTKLELNKFENVFLNSDDLSALYKDVRERERSIGLESIFKAGFKEFTSLHNKIKHDPNAIMSGTTRAMRIVINHEEERLTSGLSFLATVGSVSPYIGLFGTVWGIMNSFRGLANAGQTTLATVAPGIAEALIATAIGLFAAIPAVITYNIFSNKIDFILNRFDTFAEEFGAILHRYAHSSTKE